MASSFHISSSEKIGKRAHAKRENILALTQNILDRKEISCYHEYEQK
jgi:hypothetical protein